MSSYAGSVQGDEDDDEFDVNDEYLRKFMPRQEDFDWQPPKKGKNVISSTKQSKANYIQKINALKIKKAVGGGGPSERS